MIWIIAILIGAATGVISGFGIGGGSLLMLYLTMLVGIEQRVAGGINLLYFCTCAPFALIGHIRNRLVDWSTAIWVAAAGCAASFVASRLAHAIDVSVLKQGFGVLLIYIGCKELFFQKVDEKREMPYNKPHQDQDGGEHRG